MSALPPPRPFTAAPSCLTSSLAFSPRSCAAGLTATTNGTAVVLTLGDQRDHRGIGAEFSADVADEAAQICGRCPAGHPLRHDTDLTDLLGARGGVHCGGARVGQPHPVEFLLRGLQPIHQLRHPRRNLLRRNLQRRRQSRHQRAFLGEVAERVEADVGLHPAHAGADRRLAENRDRADLRRIVHVRAAAQLQRERAADLDHPHLLGIGLAEQRHRAHRLGLLEFGGEAVHLVVGLDGLVGDLFDLRPLILGQRTLPVEVESQIAGAVQRACLNGVGAQHLSQSRMHHVGAGVTLRSAVAPPRINGRDDGVALDELAGFHVDAVRPERFGDLLDVGDGRLRRAGRGRSGDAALVGDLTAGLGVERCAIQDQLDALGLLTVVRHHRNPLTVDEDAENSCLGG